MNGAGGKRTATVVHLRCGDLSQVLFLDSHNRVPLMVRTRGPGNPIWAQAPHCGLRTRDGPLIQKGHLSVVHIIDCADDLDLTFVFHLIENGTVQTNLLDCVPHVTFTNHRNEFRILRISFT